MKLFYLSLFTLHFTLFTFHYSLFTFHSWAASNSRSAHEIVQKLQLKYEQIDSFSADFRQVFSSRGFKTEESGILTMAKPGRMYWEYRHPTAKFFVADGEKAYFYVPKDKQVMISDLQLEGAAGTPLLFLLGKGDIDEDFRVERETEEAPLQPDNLLIRLTPKQPQGEFSYLLLEIDRSNYRISRLSVVEPIGNRNDYILTNFRENVRIPPRRFVFDIPSGVEVIGPH